MARAAPVGISMSELRVVPTSSALRVAHKVEVTRKWSKENKPLVLKANNLIGLMITTHKVEFLLC